MSTTNTPTPLAAPTGSRKERPILFSGSMVQAILTGRKTQTRRIVKPQPTADEVAEGLKLTKERWLLYGHEYRGHAIRCPYGAPGDRLWVKETWMPYDASPTRSLYRSDDPAGHIDRGWHPSIYMPRWASRITLEIVAVRVERLQDISEDEARLEGAQPMEDLGNVYASTRSGSHFLVSSFRDGFKYLWDTINGTGAWDLNPWVWVVEFKTSNTEVSGSSAGPRH